MNQNKNRFSPLMMALCVVIGILIGTFYANHFSGNRLSIINSSSNKLNNLLHIIDSPSWTPTVSISLPRTCSRPTTTCVARSRA